jgi:hypothetical protein
MGLLHGAGESGGTVVAKGKLFSQWHEPGPEVV